jgi:tetratricopeptide (TPR) repeat protein
MSDVSVDGLFSEARRKRAEHHSLKQMLVILDSRRNGEQNESRDGQTGAQDGTPDDGSSTIDQQLYDMIKCYHQSLADGSPNVELSEELAIALFRYGTNNSASEDRLALTACVEVQSNRMDLRFDDDAERAQCSLRLAMFLLLLGEPRRSAADVAIIDESIHLFREALELNPNGDSLTHYGHQMLGSALFMRHVCADNSVLLDESIRHFREALALRPVGHLERHSTCNDLATALLRQCEEEGDNTVIDEVISLYREALDLRRLEDSERAESCTGLGSALWKRALMSGKNSALLDESVGLHREALALQPIGHPNRHLSYNNLAAALYDTFDITGDEAVLDEAIKLHREALALRPVGHLHRPWSCINLGIALLRRFEITGDAAALDEAIELQTAGLCLPTIGGLEQHHLRYSLANSLYARFEHTGDAATLDRVIQLRREVLVVRPEGHMGRHLACDELAKSLHAQYKLAGDAMLLDEAIVLHREAQSLRPVDHADHFDSCINLALALTTRFELVGESGLLDEAVRLDREALSLRPQGHPERSLPCGNLAVLLHARWSQTEDDALLDEAIELYREALYLQPVGHPNRHSSCRNLAAALLARPNSSMRLLEEAAQLLREALALKSPGHPERPMSCSNLAIALHRQSLITGNGTFLAEAIQYNREALDLRPCGHPQRCISCINLASSLFDQLEITNDEGLYDEISALSDEAVSLCPPGHPDRWRGLVQRAKLSRLHHNYAAVVLDLHEMITSATRSIPELLSVTLELTKLIDISVLEHSDQQTLLKVYEHTLDLTILTAGFLFGRSYQLQRMTGARIIGPRVFVLANRLGEFRHGVQLLERARGIIWSQMLHIRDPQIELVPTDLASQLQNLLGSGSGYQRGEAVLPPSPLPSFLSDRDARHEQHIQLQHVLGQIRSIPGLHDYMRGPDVHSLLMVATRNPVVILIPDETQSYALVIRSPKEPLTVVSLEVDAQALQSLAFATSSSEMRGSLRDCEEDQRTMRISKGMSTSHAALAKLWRLVVKPVLAHMQSIVSDLAPINMT